jgi:large conductance mechanosensitive channel
MAAESRPSFLDPRKAFTLFDEFKNFAFKGNVIDLAVGMIIGTAFTNIVNSLVKNVIMPLISVIAPGNQGYAEWKPDLYGKEIPVGVFLADMVNFLLVALVLFLFIRKFLGWILQARKQQAVAPPPPPRQEVLLEEIRDLLKQRAV